MNKVIPKPTNYTDFDPEHAASFCELEYQVSTSAKVYFSFAVRDLESDESDRALVNALSNAKRALHLQVETLANAFGFQTYFSKKRPNFHDYLDFCKEVGVVAPKILKRVNAVRNAVEHDYYIPKLSEVEDFIDVVELFLVATDRFFIQFPTEFEFLPRTKLIHDLPEIRSVEMLPYSGEIYLLDMRVEYIKGESWSSYKERCAIKVSATHEHYLKWLKLLIEKVYQA